MTKYDVLTSVNSSINTLLQLSQINRRDLSTSTQAMFDDFKNTADDPQVHYHNYLERGKNIVEQTKKDIAKVKRKRGW